MGAWTESNIPDVAGHVVLVTGANSGIGFHTARALAEHGATVVMACRNPEKAEAAAADVDALEPSGSIELAELDLSDLRSVEAAADQFRESHDRLDVLINNAGLMATPNQRTAQGFEMQIGVNHLGHFALTGYLIDTLLDTPASRVVSVSSQGHRPGRIDLDDLNSDRSYSAWGAYFQSKLANLLFTNELQRRFVAAGADSIAVAAHPGASRTNLGNESAGGVLSAVMERTRPLLERVMSQDAEMGALPTLRAATDPDVAGGDYYGPAGLGEMKGHPTRVGMSSRAKDEDVARRLWEISEHLTEVTYPI